MSTHLGSSSCWMESSIPSFTPLHEDQDCDVCIIGGGIAGLTTAYLLSKEGATVILLEDGLIGSGETERTTAHIVNALDDRYMWLEKIHGDEGAKLAAESHTHAIDWIEKTVQNEHISCGFERVPGYLFLGPGKNSDFLRNEHQACKRAGLKEVEILDRAPLDSFDTGICLHFPRQAQFHPRQYLRGLAEATIRHGGRICTQTHASAVKGGKDAHVETTAGYTVRARHIVIATNAPVHDSFTLYTRQAPYRTYVIGAAVPKDEIPPVLLWDTNEQEGSSHPTPYHYIRIAPYSSSQDLLIVGGQDHRTGQHTDANARFSRLERWTRAHFPTMEDIVYHWSGQVMEPVDGLAFIGRNPLDEENVYIITGDSGNGMTHGTLGGVIINDFIQGRKNRWQELYDPSRIRLKATKELIAENLNVAKELVADWVAPSEIADIDDLQPGEGAVMRSGISRVAVYRDEQGITHEYSAVCPHKGCIVSWNGYEKSWDCPCHGSRFSEQGTVVNGPSIDDLRTIKTSITAKKPKRQQSKK